MQAIDAKNIQKLAESGDVSAQMQLGKLLLAHEQYEEAAGWFRRAAERDDREAQCILASLLNEGLGVDQDNEASAYWLRQAAEAGYPAAQVALAESFESGIGVPVNHAIAAGWYKKAAEQGDIIAQLRYGRLLRHGDGVGKDLSEAGRWLLAAANSGNAEAQVELAQCLVETPGYDMQEVMRWSKAAAEQGLPEGVFQLAWCYENAVGELRNVAAAEKWYRQAAEHGCKDAQMRLAKLYAEGTIVTQDQEEAERWLNLAVADQSDTAQHTPNAAEAAVGAVIVQEYPPGSVIDQKYFIMSTLGKGGMCRVYKAKHLVMNRMVALKMMLPEMSTDQRVVKRFQREAQTVGALNHPNVVTIYDLGVTPDGKPFIVMDYLEGQSLDQVLASSDSMPLSKFLWIFAQVCAALAAAHEMNIIHRDIKPSNIMLTKTKKDEELVKVVDFGLAKVVEAGPEDLKLTKTGEVFGTLFYMSPEQCLGHPMDHRTDIYGVGCTMYEALTGEPVYTGNTPFELMNKHINEPPMSIAQRAPQVVCPPELDRAILKALAKNREERFASISELQKILEDLQARL